MDETAQELYLTVEHNNSIIVYPKNASGNQKPIRIVEGGLTRLADPHGIAIDTRRNLMFVANHGNFKDRRVAAQASSSLRPLPYILSRRMEIPPLCVSSLVPVLS